MNADFIKDFVGYVAAGDAAVSVVLNIISRISAIKARGREPTQDELHQIALDARAEFLTLPRPEPTSG